MADFHPQDVEPWLPVNSNYKERHQRLEQEQNPDSLLNYYKHLLHVRKSSALERESTFRFTIRKGLFRLPAPIPKSQTVLVILNFSEHALELDFSRYKRNQTGKNLHCFSSAERRGGSQSSEVDRIAPFEVFIAEVTS
jgi:glycosidase